MILTSDQLIGRPADLRADVCIVGGGVVGLELAAELTRGSLRVIVLERRSPAQTQPGDRVGRIRESGRKLVRRPGAGGAWSGEWRIPDPGEWEDRPWFGKEPAPLSWEDVLPFARQVMEDHAVPRKIFEESPVWRDAPDVSGLAVSRSFFEQAPSDLLAANLKVVTDSGNVTLVTGALVSELIPAPGGGSVGEVAIRAADGKSVRITTRVVVLASGPIQTVRLMLLSNRFGGIGPGNLSGLLGRGLMDHFDVPLGVIVPGKKATAGGFAAAKRQGQGVIEPRLILNRDRRAQLGLPSHAVVLADPVQGEKGGLGSVIRGMMTGPQSLAVALRIEQTPNAVGGIKLDVERDETGLPMADVRWELSSADVDGVRGFIAELTAAFGPQWGTVTIADGVDDTGKWTAAGHLRGGAPIGASWRTGVVDRDCAVFGVQNLFIAGSAVMPVCGAGDPSLVSLALARRLAAHLGR